MGDEVDNLPTSRRTLAGPHLAQGQPDQRVYLQEWDIPFEQVEAGRAHRAGPLGPVHRGRWHARWPSGLLEMDGHNQDHLKLFKKEA